VLDKVVKNTDELGQVTSFAYDDLDRRIGITDVLNHTQTTVYDAEGNIRSSTDGVGNTINYGYDVLNRQVKVTDAKGGALLAPIMMLPVMWLRLLTR
jgi:YD repeat-containing protein